MNSKLFLIFVLCLCSLLVNSENYDGDSLSESRQVELLRYRRAAARASAPESNPIKNLFSKIDGKKIMEFLTSIKDYIANVISKIGKTVEDIISRFKKETTSPKKG